MTLRIPKLGVVGLLLTVAASAALFVYLMGRFGGPTVSFSPRYLVTVTIPDTKQLAVRSDVDVRGVKVGQVERIVLERAAADVTFSIDARYAPIHRDATVRVGEKTLLGESYIDLDPGHSAAGRLAGGAHLGARSVLPASVEIDQALNALDAPARGHLKGMLETLATGASAPSAPAQVGDTLAQLSSATTALRHLTGLLHGQEADIAQGVQAADAVLAQLGERQSEVQAIVAGGKATLGALAAREGALRAGISELPPLLSTAQRALHDARPLLADARPLLADLRAAAPPFASALQMLPPVTAAASSVIAGLGAFNQVAVPVLALARNALALTEPVSLVLAPGLRNLVTVVTFLSAHRREIAAWFSNTADLGASRDATGYFARFFVFVDPGAAFGYKGDFQNNAYTRPGDELNNQPYSGYPHLEPYTPPRPGQR